MKLLNIGSLNIDYMYRVEHFASPGETMSCLGYQISAGGKGLNQSIAAARAGAKVCHAGYVGKNGDVLLWALRDAKVDVEHIVRTDDVDGHAVIQVSATGENSILVFGGTNKQLKREYVSEVLSRFDEGDIVLVQNETNLVDFIMETAFERGIRVAFNASPLDAAVPNYPIEKVSFLFVNEIEGKAIAGMNDTMASPVDTLRAISKKYPGCEIILTAGKDGAYFCSDEEMIHAVAFHVEADKIKDTTGAGDTFLGYFLAGVMSGLPVGDNLKRACVASGMAIQREGASTGIPGIDEVNEVMASRQMG